MSYPNQLHDLLPVSDLDNDDSTHSTIFPPDTLELGNQTVDYHGNPYQDASGSECIYILLFSNGIVPSSPSDIPSQGDNRKRSKRTCFLSIEKKCLNIMCDYYLHHRMFMTNRQIAEAIYTKLYCEEMTNRKIYKLRQTIRLRLNKELSDCRSSKIVYHYLMNFIQRRFE